MAQWKPSVGDRFECQVSDYSYCGDWECSGLDTVLFEIIDTAFDAGSQHSNAVLATTSAIGLHLTYSVWGNGWESSEVDHEYSDTTLVASSGPRMIETSFNGYNVGYQSWTQLLFNYDTSVIFQGRSYAASYAGGAAFLPTLGWFLSLAGYESNGPCTSQCLEETWTLSLISASKVHSIVQSESHSKMRLLAKGGLLQLENVEASNITLMDLLGRVVNSWQFPLSGPREITLNVADVPTGIYFLRISGKGMDEVKKVCIAH